MRSFCHFESETKWPPIYRRHLQLESARIAPMGHETRKYLIQLKSIDWLIFYCKCVFILHSGLVLSADLVYLSEQGVEVTRVDPRNVRSTRSRRDTGGPMTARHVVATRLKNRAHDDVIKWKHFPCYWPFVRGIHRWPVNPPCKGQWRGVLMFSLIWALTNRRVNNSEACDLRRHCVHYDVILMK